LYFITNASSHCSWLQFILYINKLEFNYTMVVINLNFKIKPLRLKSKTNETIERTNSPLTSLQEITLSNWTLREQASDKIFKYVTGSLQSWILKKSRINYNAIYYCVNIAHTLSHGYHYCLSIVTLPMNLWIHIYNRFSLGHLNYTYLFQLPVGTYVSSWSILIDLQSLIAHTFITVHWL